MFKGKSLGKIKSLKRKR